MLVNNMLLPSNVNNQIRVAIFDDMSIDLGDIPDLLNVPEIHFFFESEYNYNTCFNYLV
jgi:hypothetical protein